MSTPKPPSVGRAIEVVLVVDGRRPYRTGDEPPNTGKVDSLPPSAVDLLVRNGLAAIVTRGGGQYVIPTAKACDRTARLRWSEALQHYERGRAIVARCHAGDWRVVDGTRVEVVVEKIRPPTDTNPTTFRERHEQLDWQVSPTATLHPEPAPT